MSQHALEVSGGTSALREQLLPTGAASSPTGGNSNGHPYSSRAASFSSASSSTTTVLVSPRGGTTINGADSASATAVYSGAGAAEFSATPAPAAAADGSPIYRVYPQRYWVLFLFCFVAFGQGLVWISLSPITKLSKEYYGISTATVDLLLNYGTILYVAAAPFASQFGSTPQGLRRMILLAAWLEALAALLRVVPELPGGIHDALHREGAAGGVTGAVVLLHIGAILNAVACPPVAVTCTKLSCVWFGERERTSVTALAVVANNAGTAAGMLFAPYLVSEANDMPKLMWLQLAYTFAGLVACLVYLPAMPPTHPSPAAAVMFERASAAAAATAAAGSAPTMATAGGEAAAQFSSSSSSSSVAAPAEAADLDFLPAARAILRNKDFVLMALSCGLAQGLLTTWCSVLSTILPDSYSQTTIGWFSFGSTFASIVGGVVMAFIAQRDSCRRRIKTFIVALLVIAMLSAALFASMLPSPFSSSSLIPASTPVLGTIITLLGWCIGSAYPLAFELAAEQSFPLPEAASGGVLSMWTNACGIALLFVAPSLSGSTMNAIFVATLVLCVVLAPLVRENYKRQDAEAKAKHDATAGAAATASNTAASATPFSSSSMDRLLTMNDDDTDDDAAGAVTPLRPPAASSAAAAGATLPDSLSALLAPPEGKSAPLFLPPAPV
jgi:sugar phosphate permease